MAPHLLVSVSFAGLRGKQVISQFAVPYVFPLEPPIGPQKEQDEVKWPWVLGQNPPEFKDALCFWRTAATTHLANIHGVDGKQREKRIAMQEPAFVKVTLAQAIRQTSAKHFSANTLRLRSLISLCATAARRARQELTPELSRHLAETCSHIRRLGGEFASGFCLQATERPAQPEHAAAQHVRETVAEIAKPRPPRAAAEYQWHADLVEQQAFPECDPATAPRRTLGVAKVRGWIDHIVETHLAEQQGGNSPAPPVNVEERPTEQQGGSSPAPLEHAFQPAASFEGSRRGSFLGKGELGLGYYPLLEPMRPQPAEPAACANPIGPALAAVFLSDDLALHERLLEQLSLDPSPAKFLGRKTAVFFSRFVCIPPRRYNVCAQAIQKNKLPIPQNFQTRPHPRQIEKTNTLQFLLRSIV